MEYLDVPMYITKELTDASRIHPTNLAYTANRPECLLEFQDVRVGHGLTVRARLCSGKNSGAVRICVWSVKLG